MTIDHKISWCLYEKKEKAFEDIPQKPQFITSRCLIILNTCNRGELEIHFIRSQSTKFYHIIYIEDFYNKRERTSNVY